MTKKQKIIIVHGWSYSLEKWHDFLSLLQKAGYECELLTVPGLTESIETVWTLDDYVQWLDKKLPSGEKYTILGHSNGGRIALAYAHRFPQKVQSLILIASAGVIHDDFTTQLKKLIFQTAAKTGKLITRSEKFKKILYKLAREQDYYQATPVMKQTMVNLISADIVPLLPEIKAPALLIWGKKDQVTPVSDGKKIQQAMRNAQLFILSTARHSPQFTHPQEVVEIIQKNFPKL